MNKEPTKLKTFDLSQTRPQVLLLGNGLCIQAGGKTCGSLIEDAARAHHCPYDKKTLELLDFPMRIVAASDDHVDTVCKNLRDAMTQADYYTGSETFFRSYLRLPMDAFLTTNYSYDLEMAMDSRFLRHRLACGRFTESKDKREGRYQLHSFYAMQLDEDQKHIWHIHGEAANKSSMVLGHYYYGDLLCHYKQELNKYGEQWRDNQDYLLQPRSWLDYFIYGDVYIAGFSFDLAEMDLWWLLNRKKREKRPKGRTVVFVCQEETLSIQQRMMLKAYGAEIVMLGNGSYDDYHVQVVDYVSNAVQARNDEMRA